MKNLNGDPEMPDKGPCIAIIPARGGSKGIPHKNIRPVGGVPLVARSIRAALASTAVSCVYVSTDDPEIAQVATSYGAKVIMRPATISGDAASSEDALLHALDTLETCGCVPETLVFLQCTSPFTTPEAIDSVVAALDNPSYAMAFSAVEDHGFLWGISSDGSGHGINHNHTLPRKRRQELPKQLRETGAVYVMRVKAFKQHKNRFCGPAKPVELSLPLFEIDTPEDLLLVEALLASSSVGDTKTKPPKGIKVLVTDFDGVHTDDCVYLNQNGEESVKCSRSDGMGIEMLRKAGIAVLILSKESNPVVSARAKKLGIPVIQQCEAKKPTLEKWLTEQGLTPQQLAYMGNDLNDLECLNMAAWACCPADARPEVKAVAHYVTEKNGGHGAVREVADCLLMHETM